MLLSPLLTRLITLDEANAKRSGCMFLHGQRNFLACLERLFSLGAFDESKEACLSQLLFNQVKSGGLEVHQYFISTLSIEIIHSLIVSLSPPLCMFVKMVCFVFMDDY